MRRTFAVVAVTLLVGACSGGGHAKKSVPKGVLRTNIYQGLWDVCGQKIPGSQAGFAVEDGSRQDIVVNRTSPPNGEVYLWLSHDCNADVHYQVVPADAATVLDAAPTAKPVAVVLHPVAQTFTVTFQRPSGPGKVTVDLTQPTTSPPPSTR